MEKERQEEKRKKKKRVDKKIHSARLNLSLHPKISFKGLFDFSSVAWGGG